MCRTWWVVNEKSWTRKRIIKLPRCPKIQKFLEGGKRRLRLLRSPAQSLNAAWCNSSHAHTCHTPSLIPLDVFCMLRPSSSIALSSMSPCNYQNLRFCMALLCSTTHFCGIMPKWLKHITTEIVDRYPSCRSLDLAGWSGEALARAVAEDDGLVLVRDTPGQCGSFFSNNL